MKIATMNVGHCGQCPYYEASRRVSCHLAKRHTPATLDIPSWCPLPDAVSNTCNCPRCTGTPDPYADEPAGEKEGKS